MRDDSNFVKLRCLKKEREVYHYSNELCNFGNGYGFLIENDCKTKEYGLSELGLAGVYELPEAIKAGTREA